MGRLSLALTLLIGFGATAIAGDQIRREQRIKETPAESFAREIDAVREPHAKPDLRSERPRGEADSVFPQELGATGMLVFGLTVVGGFVVGIIAIVMLRRYRRPTVEQHWEPVSLLVAEHAARTMRKRAGVFALLGIGGGFAIFGAGIPIFPWIFAISTVPAIRGFWIARSALRLIAGAGAIAEAAGSTIRVSRNARSVALHLIPPELAAAKRRGVPAASTMRGNVEKPPSHSLR